MDAQLDTHELAWAAGFFDGEGCSHYHKDGGGLTIHVSQVDRRPLDRFHMAVGRVGKVKGPRQPSNPRGTPIHSWKVQGRAAEQVRQLLWPYLSEPKKEQFLRTLEKVAERPPKSSRKRLLQSEREELRRLHSEGWGRRQLAERFGIHPATAWSVANKLGKKERRAA